MGIISSISSITGKAEKVAKCYLAELEANDATVPGSIQAFQHFPETISDNRGVNYRDKTGIGSSHPIYQWVGGSPREISFEAVFAADEEPIDPSTGLEAIGRTIASINRNPIAAGAKLISDAVVGNKDVNKMDVASGIAWLRSKTYPIYQKNNSVLPPPRLLLWLENSRITSFVNGYELDVVPVIMTRCDVTYEAFFRSGAPRVAMVSLGFNEIIQVGQNWKYISKTDFDRAWKGVYNQAGPSEVPKNAARGAQGSSGAGGLSRFLPSIPKVGLPRIG